VLHPHFTLLEGAMVTYFFRTYGCQANVADSQGLAQFLDELGCSEAQSEAAADLVIVNTCAVRDKAEQKLFSYLGELGQMKKERPYMKLGVIGCVASYKKNEIYTRFDQVNFVYGAREEIPALKAYLADLIVSLETTKQLYETNPEAVTHSGGQDRDVKKVVQLKNLFKTPSVSGAFGLKKKVEEKPAIATKPLELKRSFINIMTGCNKYCAYCIVPFTRGREVSYPMTQILEQVQHDVLNGAKEVTLIGQNVNSYIDPESNEKFPELLRRVAQIEGEFWVRFVSPHPQDMTREMFEVIAANRPKLTAYIHFPVQSGSDKVLEMMKRNYTAAQYLEQIGWLRDLMPDATISTDIIVGFPGESEEDYLATRQLMETVRYDLIYSFIYSPRKYTQAVKMEDSCPPEEKTRRLEELQKRQIEICLEQNLRHVGKTMKALVEKRLTNGKLLARTEGNIRVVFDGDDNLIGSFIDLRIDKAGPVNMEAVFVANEILSSKQKEIGGIAKW
jgi:tRNA-2-methylthio-N6-dimethylallyladenosine synthase